MTAFELAGPQGNPFSQDVEEPLPEPAILVVFGATGDLSDRKLLPAIYNLGVGGHLPEHFRLIGVANDSGADDFPSRVKGALERFSRSGVDKDAWRHFAERLSFVAGDFSDSALYQRLSDELERLDHELGIQTRRFFYLAIAPAFFGEVAARLDEVGLGAGATPPTYLLVEKPFGHDLDSARVLNKKLASAFKEDQILRIDHYLAKETVQNLLFFRFTNGIFEPIWNRRYVDHVQITVAEDIGIGQRAAYYDRAGALRDVVQNHILQLAALIGMEPPTCFDADLVHDEKIKFLRAAETLSLDEVADNVVRGQYTAGAVGGEAVVAYRDEDGVADDSQTDTYVAMRLTVDNWRWAGTPFYLRTGKRLPVKLTEIVVAFRPVPHLPISASGAKGVVPNELIFQIQPNEGASLRLVAKAPGLTTTVRPVQMDFQYGTSFIWESPEAYERLLHDALLDDRTRFISSAEVESTWEIVDPVLKAWSEGQGQLSAYEAGTSGPADADNLVSRGGRHWRRL